MTYSPDEVSKLRALNLWDTGKIDEIEVGTIKGLQQIHKILFAEIEGYNAGEIRQINISKDNFLFASAIYLPQALSVIEQMPQLTFEEIIDKYVEMNIAHPFIEGNGRATRIWLDLILKNSKSVKKCIDWDKIDKQEYLDFMRLSPTNSKYIKKLLFEALTDKINDREIFMKGIDKSYEYESIDAISLEQLSKKENNIELEF